MIRDECIRELKQNEEYCHAAREALAHYHAECLKGGISIAPGLRPRDLLACRATLDDTYIVRLFALFEVALRNYWKYALNKTSHPKAMHLLDSIAPRLYMRTDVLSNAHKVREYRNSIVHEAPAFAMLTIGEARKHLCVYLSNFPRAW